MLNTTANSVYVVAAAVNLFDLMAKQQKKPRRAGAFFCVTVIILRAIPCLLVLTWQ
jgi:hypothetical protein